MRWDGSQVIAEPIVLVAMPARFGLPYVPSDKRRCERCYGDVWVSKTAQLDEYREHAAAITKIVCTVCAMALVKVGDEITRAPWANRDLLELEGEL